MKVRIFFDVGSYFLFSEVLKRFFFFAGIVIVFIAGCKVKYPVTDDAVSPFLSNLTVPRALYLLSDIGYSVSVRVTDPQGWEDIRTVKVFLFRVGSDIPVLEDTLSDDGAGGDIIPRDGVFFDNLTITFTGGIAGQYLIEVLAEDVSQNLSNILMDTLDVIDSEKNFPPILSDPVVPDTLTVQTLGDVFFSIRAGDPQGMVDIDSVFFQIYPPWKAVPSFQDMLRDNGTAGDVDAGDGIFSYRGNLSDTLKIRGEYLVRFQATDNGGLKSSAVVESFYVMTVNDPPVLSNLAAPDTVSRSAAQPFLLTVQVGDPQGLGDVKSVLFNTTKPDGTPSGGNPFEMFDDGTSGDVQPGDGIYSLTVFITPQNATGIYRFDFSAEDYSLAVSDTLTHFMTVVD